MPTNIMETYSYFMLINIHDFKNLNKPFMKFHDWFITGS